MRRPHLLLTIAGASLAFACGDPSGVVPAADLRVSPAWSQPVLLAEAGSLLPIACRTVEHGMTRDVASAATVRVAGGVVHGTRCDNLRVRRSGVDTLHVSHAGATASVVIAVALPPIVQEGSLGEWLHGDALLARPLPWSPSVRRNARGDYELYVTHYTVRDGVPSGPLHRYVSADGRSFTDDGLVLRPSADRCSPMGDGIEHVAIVRRAEAPGWRMFFAAGSNICYGWQVHSAVSPDARSWEVEPGVRVSNGGGLPPTLSGNPYWGQGEGMVVDRMIDGTWRMIQGGMEIRTPGELRFQITEWRSTDQLEWRYIGPVLTTWQMPASARSSIASPAIREFAPGLYRMIVYGDNREYDDPRSLLLSAVSRDLRDWVVEGQLIGARDADVWYAALQDERLFFVRQDKGMAERRMAAATVRMP
jgi:hypothetical protein